MYNNIENKTGMKHYKRTRKQLIKEEPKLCSNGSIQWGKFNIKLDVNPDVSFSGVDWKGGSYGCSISWVWVKMDQRTHFLNQHQHMTNTYQKEEDITND